MIPPLVCCAALTAQAVDVYVKEQTSAGGTVTALRQTVAPTGAEFTTQIAPDIDGYIFTHWSLSVNQSYAMRDALARTYDALPFMVYEETTATAHYVPATTDEDTDGIADGHELYWYGDISKDGASDTDNDGLTFAEELAAGTSLILADNSLRGGVVWSDSELHQYNPNGLQSYTIRSEPEGTLFEAITDYAKVGESITSPTGDVSTTAFAYWTMNGQRVADVSGRAVDTVVFKMPNEPVELVAHTAENETERLALYWYGNANVAQDSDTDGDGYTFTQELAAGTSPLLPDRSLRGGVVWADSELHQYNPENVQSYVIRSEPEGELFETISDYAKIGSKVTTPTGDWATTSFAYWTMNGERVTDLSGRAVDTVTFSMPETAVELVAHTAENETDRAALYWYGKTDIALTSDTDGDGLTFAEELAAGTSPLLADRSLRGGVAWSDSSLHDMNLQPYEQVQGAVVGGVFEQLFTSPIAGNGETSATFGEGGAVWPVVADVNGDGKWDIVVCWEKESGGVKSLEFGVFLNVGSAGNPEFVEGKNVSIPPSVDLMMNSTDKLAGLTLDIEPINALSATTNGTTLLVSDTEGRIWYYEGLVVDSDQSLVVSGQGAGDRSQGTGDSSKESGGSNSKLQTLNYQLQHKVWGGSYAGFANGLRLAAVDWEDDGDLDCICGTAEGKLMLLRDPKVGHPTNVKALVGVDNVLLTWDPNAQSRIRGYKVYRAEADSTEFSNIAQPQLPAHRDFPPNTGAYDYKVSSVSRFYTAGNSTPTVTESPATEAVSAQLGTVKFFWNDVICKLGENANVMLSIENSMNFNVAGKTQVVSYDPIYLKPIKVVPSGLTEGVSFTESVADGKWTINLINGNLPAGSGKFFTLVFETLKEGETKVGDAKVTIEKVESIDLTVVPPWSLGDMNGDGRLTKEDAQILARLKQSSKPKWNKRELRSGDFNGNGKLDNADYQALRERLKSLGVYGGVK